MLKSIFNSESITLDLDKLLLCMVSAIILGIVIALVHKKTTNTSKNFIETIAILPILIAVVIMMVNGNLGTGVAVAGAFSLVRFRSVPGNSKEIMTVFFVMAIGLALGMGHIAFAIIVTIIVCIFILILNYINKNAKNIQSLTILIPENLDYNNLFDETLKKYTNSYKIEKIKTTNMGSLFELNYLIELKNNINTKQFIDELRIMNGNLKISLNNLMIEGEL